MDDHKDSKKDNHKNVNKRSGKTEIPPTSRENGSYKAVNSEIIVDLKDMSSAEVMAYYDDFCKRKKIPKPSNLASSIWWAMQYKWKEKGEWIEYEDDYYKT
jgi:hypothetical protein